MNTYSEDGRAGASIINGDQIKVRENSFAAIIYLDDRSILKVRENTTFSFMDTGNSILYGKYPIRDFWIFSGFLLDYIQALFFILFPSKSIGQPIALHIS